MIRSKKEISEILRRGFIYYLFDGCQVIINLHLYVFPLLNLFLAGLLWLVFGNTSVFYILAGLCYSMWLAYNFIIRSGALRGLKLTVDELKKEILLHNYRDGSEGVFEGSKVDIMLIDTVMEEFRNSAKRFSVIGIIRTIILLVLFLLIVGVIFITDFGSEATSVGMQLFFAVREFLMLPFVIPVLNFLLIIILMYFGITLVYFVRIRKSVHLYHKLTDLKFELIKMYKDQL